MLMFVWRYLFTFVYEADVGGVFLFQLHSIMESITI